MKNERLASTVKESKSKRRRYAFEDPAMVAKANAIRLAKHPPRPRTTNMRVQCDAVKLCKAAWSDRNTRVEVTSDILRKAAKSKLGI